MKRALFSLLSICLLLPWNNSFAVASLRPCTNIEVARIANFDRQSLAVNGLKSSADLRFQKSAEEFKNATATGNSSAAASAQIASESAKQDSSKYGALLESISKSKKSITSSCSTSTKSKNGSKLPICGTDVLKILARLSGQFASSQSLIHSTIDSIKDNKIKYRDYIASGQLSSAARYQLEIEKSSKALQDYYTQATLIEQEFTNTKSSCNGSKIELPPKYEAPQENSSTPSPAASASGNSQQLTPAGYPIGMNWTPINNVVKMHGVNGFDFSEKPNMTDSGEIKLGCPSVGFRAVPSRNIKAYFGLTTKLPISGSWYSDTFAYDQEPFTDFENQPKNYISKPLSISAEGKSLKLFPIELNGVNICESSIPLVKNISERYASDAVGISFFATYQVGTGTYLIYFGGMTLDRYTKLP
jgi:hypothetical protein